jgi:hypothetical protein
VVIAEVNERVPFTFGDGVLPASRIDCAVHVSRTPVEVPPAKISETDLAIAKIVAGYVEDGAVLQVGIGATPDAILRLLHDRRDLGVHSGMIGDGLVDLVEAGVITNALKPIDAGVSITGALIGTKRLYEFAHRNPKIAVRSSSYTHSDATLSRLTRLVTINGDGSRPDGTGECRAERRSVPGRHRRTSRLCPRRQPLARRSLHHCFAGNCDGRQDQSRDDSPVRTRHDRTQRRGCDRHRIRCDVFVGNDPDYGGGHLPDYNVYAPVFDDHGELVLIQALQAHQGDTGGKDPCGFTLEATDIFTEGLAIPCLKLLHRGEKRRDVIKLLERNNRFPSFAGDLAAMIGGVQLSVKRLQGVLRKWGSEAVKAAINYSIDHTEKRLREEVAAWRDGSYEATVLIDHDTLGTKDVEVHVTCTVKGDQLTVDLTGSDARPELVGVWNTFGNSRSYVMTQIAAAIDPTIVKNEGLFHAVEIVCPENTIVHPPVNKPAALGSFHPACEIIEAVCVASCRAICRPRH